MRIKNYFSILGGIMLSTLTVGSSISILGAFAQAIAAVIALLILFGVLGYFGYSIFSVTNIFILSVGVLLSPYSDINHIIGNPVMSIAIVAALLFSYAGVIFGVLKR